MSYRIIASNSLYQVITRIITSSVIFLITIFIARSFGPEGYGIFTKITTYVGLFYLCIDFGLNAFFLQEDPSAPRFRSLLYFRLLVSFVFFVLSTTVALFLPYSPESTMGFSEVAKIGVIIFSFSLFSNACIVTASAYFQKELRYDLLAKATAIGSIVTLLCAGGVFLFNIGFWAVVLSLVIGAWSTALSVLYFTKIPLLPIQIELQYIKIILKSSMPLGIMLLFNMVYFRADIFILTFMKSTIDVGIYGFAFRFFDFLIAIPLFMSNALYPFMLRHQKNPQIFYSLIQKYTLIFLAISIFFCIVCWFLAPLLSIVKPEFVASVMPFRILLLFLPTFFLTNLFQWVLITERKQKYLMTTYLVSAAINIVANITFIPLYSYGASAIITGLSEGIVLLFLLLKVRQIRKYYV